jgi:uncharacterized membrane protein YgcG
MRTPKPFEILWESRSASWAKDFGILLSRSPEPSANVRTFRTVGKGSTGKPVRGFLVSVVLHTAAFVFATQLIFTSGYVPPRNLDAAEPAPIFIDMQALKDLKILRSLPIVRPRGPGGKPGTADHPTRIIFQASTVQHPKFTVVLNPLKPDNNRQAINQKLSPPDLKIKLEQKLPDILLAQNPAVARPRVDMRFHHALKSTHNRQAIDQKLAPPDLKMQLEQRLPDVALAKGPAAAKPQVDMSLHRALAPGNVNDHPADAAPSVASNAPELAFKITPTVQQPQMPVSYFGSGSLQAPHAGGSQAGGSSAGPSGGASGQSGGASSNSSGDPSGGGIVVVSVDPATFSQLASLAQGNRYGALAIAPSKEGLGSPGGSPNGTPAGGTGGPGRGGDGSSGVGPGHSGGGGGGAEEVERATLSAVGGTGGPGGVDSNKLLGAVSASPVYPVTSPVKLRRAPLVVSTGPIGGGGLDAYGALHCGKVYTIFLPMPGKSWVLQYCAHQSAGEKPEQANAGVIQMEVGLVPPTADQQFDFRRLAIPEKDADKLIVLRGLIGKDGSTSEVQVFQGVQPEMDAEAALAFSSWKFRPATRANLPISVDVLVGIPARVREKLNEISSGAPGNQSQ